VVTTAGEIEIELWGRECPKTVRNFIALSMEGMCIPNFGSLFHALQGASRSGLTRGTGEIRVDRGRMTADDRLLRWSNLSQISTGFHCSDGRSDGDRVGWREFLRRTIRR